MNIRPALLLAAALSIVACSRRPAQPEFKPLSVDTLLTRNGNSCHVDFLFLSIGNKEKSPVLQNIEQANIGYFFQLENFQGPAEEGVAASLGEILANYLPEDNGPQGGQYDISADSEVSVLDSLLCYVITRAGYTGGAHGMYGTECHTYSLNDGFELSLADLFSETELRCLDILIREKIAARYNATTDEELTQAGFFPEYIAPTENFRLSPEGITFFYNPYDIGCYALGAVEVTVLRSELEARKRGESETPEP